MLNSHLSYKDNHLKTCRNNSTFIVSNKFREMKLNKVKEKLEKSVPNTLRSYVKLKYWRQTLVKVKKLEEKKSKDELKVRKLKILSMLSLIKLSIRTSMFLSGGEY